MPLHLVGSDPVERIVEHDELTALAQALAALNPSRAADAVAHIRADARNDDERELADELAAMLTLPPRRRQGVVLRVNGG